MQPPARRTGDKEGWGLWQTENKAALKGCGRCCGSSMYGDCPCDLLPRSFSWADHGGS